MTRLLGIDVGTSSIKSLLLDPADASIVALAAQEYPLYIPHAGYAEQVPHDWWQATVSTVKRVLSQVSDLHEIAAISFSGQMHGTVLLDAEGQPVHPAIIWADQRSAAEVQMLLDTCETADDYIAITGTLPAAGFMGATLLWLKQHQPAVLNAARHVLLPKDYVRYRMTGQFATDVTDAAGTGIFDIRQQAWAHSIINAAGLPPHILPPVIASDAVVGQLSPEAASELGLPFGIPVVAGCADQPAQALGNGIIAPDQASITIGSGGQVFYPLADSAALRMDRRVHVFNHATGGWYALGAILAAGLNMRWLRGIVGLQDDSSSYARLSAEAADIPAGADGLLFLPYLNGERTPHMDATARGAWIGLAAHHTRAHLARAIMEGVAFALRQSFEICQQLGQPDVQIIVSGGGVESYAWRQILADVIGMPLYRAHQREQAAVGAAMLAGVGVRLFAQNRADNFAALRDRLAHHEDVTLPRQTVREFYERRYQHYCEFYPRLRGDFHRLNKNSD